MLTISRAIGTPVLILGISALQPSIVKMVTNLRIILKVEFYLVILTLK